jgi:hypothetical protein
LFYQVPNSGFYIIFKTTVLKLLPYAFTKDKYFAIYFDFFFQQISVGVSTAGFVSMVKPT